ncbi:MAG: hypothetical protein GX575_30180 [Candidatus Anammoximicrobium sp.]|mgnify:CR=1 FL=1|nr:hypothetical protein [Candidatus Anammoximicrobium sp.]
MSKQKSSELLETLAELRRRYPAWRFGQMMENIAGWADQDVWDVSDDALLEAARVHLGAAANRKEEVCV